MKKKFHPNRLTPTRSKKYGRSFFFSFFLSISAISVVVLFKLESVTLLPAMMMKLQVVDSFVVVPSGSGFSYDAPPQSYSPRPRPRGRQHFVGGNQKKLVVLNFFGMGEKKKKTNDDDNKNNKEDKKDNENKKKNVKTNTGKTAYNYAGTRVDNDEEEVVVPATTYFAQKNDPLIPVIGGSFFLTIFTLLGWWLFSPTPEGSMRDVNEMTYESMTQDVNSNSRIYKKK